MYDYSNSWSKIFDAAARRFLSKNADTHIWYIPGNGWALDPGQQLEAIPCWLISDLLLRRSVGNGSSLEIYNLLAKDGKQAHELIRSLQEKDCSQFCDFVLKIDLITNAKNIVIRKNAFKLGWELKPKDIIYDDSTSGKDYVYVKDILEFINGRNTRETLKEFFDDYVLGMEGYNFYFYF